MSTGLLHTLYLLGAICLSALPAQAQVLTAYNQNETFPSNDSLIPSENQSEPGKISDEKWKPSLINVGQNQESKNPAKKNNYIEADKDDLRKSSKAKKTVFQSKAFLPRLLETPTVEEQQENAPPSSDPVDLQADKMEYDEQTKTVTALGNVMIVQSGRILRADKVTYQTEKDKIIASGTVVLNEPNGDIHLADYVELRDNFNEGAIEQLKTILQDGSRFSANSGKRKGGYKTIMRSARYTPCEPCKTNPEKALLWQIKAAKVTHNEKDKDISYQHARFEVKGVPVAYTPYFSHPDGSIKQKSGMLAPSIGYKSRLGAFAENRYYWAIAPDKDLTAGVLAMTKEKPLGLLQWRQRWNKAELELNGGITKSSRTDRIGGEKVIQEEEVRGHILGEGLWEMNDKWRSGFNIEWASDDQYMRQYGFSGEEVLENEIYAERFSGRNYAVGRFLAFQDVRVRDEQVEQPEVIPEIIASFKGTPGAVPIIKGQWNVDTSFLGLQRDGNDQDMNRFNLTGSWSRHFISDYGLVGDLSAVGRVDLYNTRDRDVASVPGSGQGSSNTETRFFPSLTYEARYPVAKSYQSMQAVIEPIASMTAAPNVDVNNDIPNEDSRDAQIDALNLFENNRFPGLDRIEDRSHVTYGLSTGLYGYGGSEVSVFLGQTYRLDDNDNPFPRGSGLNKQTSDYVGKVTARIADSHQLNYRFQLAEDNLQPRRNEIDAISDWGRLRLNARYFYSQALEGADLDDFDESREQLRTGLGYYLTPEWRVRTGATQDFGDKPGLRKAYLGLDYFGQCVSWALQAQRNNTDDSSGESDTEILFRIGLKNLGGFQKSGFIPDLQDKSLAGSLAGDATIGDDAYQE